MQDESIQILVAIFAFVFEVLKGLETGVECPTNVANRHGLVFRAFYE